MLRAGVDLASPPDCATRSTSADKSASVSMTPQNLVDVHFQTTSQLIDAKGDGRENRGPVPLRAKCVPKRFRHGLMADQLDVNGVLTASVARLLCVPHRQLSTAGRHHAEYGAVLDGF